MARERYLLHEGEEAIHQPEAEIKPNTRKEKWQNFWYYHKWHVWVGTALILVAAFLVHDMTSAVKPDYQVTLITQRTISSGGTDALEKAMEKYGQDLNGDGKIVVQVNQSMIGEDAAGANADIRAAGLVRLQGDLSDGTSMIFLTDDTSFQNEQKELGLFSYTDGANPAKDAADYSRMRVALKDCKAFGGLNEALPGGEGEAILSRYSVSLRVFQGTQLEGQKEKQEYYSASKKLFDRIISGS